MEVSNFVICIINKFGLLKHFTSNVTMRCLRQWLNIVAEQLSRINEQLAIKNRRGHRIWKTLAIIIGVIIAVNIMLSIIGFVSNNSMKEKKQTTVTATTKDY
ncbi:hypothetical protein [Anaerocolumna sp. MB42-C2]|uniref:hypothetical protein n=1 Tax=Anaerocolumna sp. MB42-C2 TaxID=3070997 RepID=UPI0027E169A9|nr:hypothetical protein [Anaerocolumna sp. MB42-C2]WMJ86317.1 hypothetical protein RBU59_20055 [Anaerocolumna sp. MB42-C2]